MESWPQVFAGDDRRQDDAEISRPEESMIVMVKLRFIFTVHPAGTFEGMGKEKE